MTGWVLNDTLGVLIEAQGKVGDLQGLLAALGEPPPLARITGIDIQEKEPQVDSGFTIRKSVSCESKAAVLPPDIATCGDCLNEIFDEDDRRHRYAFTNCTNCGPRYTIAHDTPYDRSRTSMSIFGMCELCQQEYDSPEDRRFHAQPNACSSCGPSLMLTDKEGKVIACDDPIGKTIELLRSGLVIAIRGLGGFHLACDALNSEAVSVLRERKRRPWKPFALMSPDIETIMTYALVSEVEREVLTSHASPIVLLRKKEGGFISELVAPGISEYGVMLPYTPLHHILLRGNFTALVMTSGNLQDEPTIAESEKAIAKLSSIADYFLLHDREILIQNDDSIARLIDGGPVLFRRARGYVPDSIDVPWPKADLPDILAVGGEEKGAVCFLSQGRAFISQHLGDLKNKESLLSFENSVEHMGRLLKRSPEIVAHDLHPSYTSTRYAQRLGNARKVPVQHHFAHVAACLAENRVNEKVIGVSFDGVGLGTDGNAWGGEFLVADLKGFQRAGHLRYCSLPGGDAAAKEPYRMAISHLHQAFGKTGIQVACEILNGVEHNKIFSIERMIERRINSPLTSSVGRLFDAVASIMGVRHVNTYEGQAAMELESLAGKALYQEDVYGFKISDEDGVLTVDASPMIRGIVGDVTGKMPRDYIASRFHNTVAMFTLRTCERIRETSDLNSITLSGGVFQNKCLTERLTSLLRDRRFKVYIHRLVPPNDGGLSLGQAVVAAHRIAGGD